MIAGPSTAHLSPMSFLDSLGTSSDSWLMLGAIGEWLPSFATPIWVLSIGLLLGAIAVVVVFGVLSLLSYVPALGTLADSPNRGVSVSLVVGAIISAILCIIYLPQGGDNQQLLLLPLITIGLGLGFGLIYGMWHRTRSEWLSMLGEGVVPYLLGTAGVFAGLGLLLTPFIEKPQAILASIPAVNVFSDGTQVEIATIDPASGDEPEYLAADIQYNFRSVAELTIESDKKVFLADSADPATFSRAPVELNPGSNEAIKYKYEDREQPPIPGDPSKLHIYNQEIDPAQVVFTFKNLPQVPQASSIVFTAIIFFLGITGLIAMRQAAPRVWALALSTAKNEMAQPLYLLLLSLGGFGILLFGIFPFYTLGDDIRLLKDSAVTLIMIMGMLLAVWSAGTSVSDEIEGRTALTVLSKPVSRRSFVLGKYAGIMLSVMVFFVILSAVLMVVLSYKPIYDARESSGATPTWQVGHEEIMTTLPVIGLYFMETMAIGGIAVALATRLPLLANFITCFSIYVIGNLTSPLVAAAKENTELVGFIGKLIAVVVPNLNSFNVQAAVDSGSAVPLIYLAGAFNYLFVFVVAVWMLAMLMFEDRDLA
ncbi:ABC transporter permease [Allorhodopirellula heiligendammensis]|uniref:ABC-2 family transporter protein n=1 Tax=Allorhodopirellula heiligendammensis TaxID=2714739 RepID=A0A5C6C8K2_9BACT|nr:ABC transporter permease [Allorhodopirellula heiligendammensis]TWU19674.1 ABC-2 family transporter protein [Allorhodopirellula heiligendammensis]